MRVKTYLRRERQGKLPKPISDETGIYEYPDALLTLYLNTLFNNNSPNALRAGITAMLPRIQSPRVRYILMTIKRAYIPSGKLNFYYSALESDLNEIAELAKKENSHKGS